MYFNKLLDAYAEIVTAAMYIRLPDIAKLLNKYPTIGLKSSYSNVKQDTIINTKSVIYSIAKEGNKRSQNLRNVMTQIARVFLIATCDIIKDMDIWPKIKNDELIQFIRHIRNGAAHNNQFTFKPQVKNKCGKNLKLAAKWRDKKIKLELEGTLVIPDFIKDGDVYTLIHDLEKFIIKIDKVKPRRKSS
jgi:hypothetical protein